jgi:hypothetical protein
MTRLFLIHLVFMILGYALAVLLATTITLMLMGAPTVLPDQGRFGSFYAYWRDFPKMFISGLNMTAIFAFPGWLIAVCAAEIRKEQRKYWFGAAGVVTAIAALFMSGLGDALSQLPTLFVGALIGGFLGGLAYWAVIGRRSGDWRKRLELSLPADPVDEGTPK